MECSDSSSYNFIWLTVVMALAGVVLVVFLLLVKITVSSGTINGLIFYANIVSFRGLLDHQNCAIHPFLHVIVSWINLDLGIEVASILVWMCTRRPGYCLCFPSTSGSWLGSSFLCAITPPQS